MMRNIRGSLSLLIDEYGMAYMIIKNKGRIKMKRWIPIIFFLFITIYLGMSSAADIDFKAQTGFNYDWWRDSTHARGQQFYIPLSLEAKFWDISLKVLTGEAYTSYDPRGSSNPSLTHLLDTKVNLSYEILDKLPLDILIGLDFNLPTGKSDLSQRERMLVFDPELVSITNFGAGFDVNPTLNIAKGFGNFTVGMGAGYAWRGEYDYRNKVFEWTHDMGPMVGYQAFYTKDYDPGEIINVNAEIRYDFSSNWYTRLFGLYTWYGKDEVDNITFYQEGDLLSIGLGINHSQKKWDAGLTVRSIFRDKSRFKGESPGGYTSPSQLYEQWKHLPISTEDRNSHGDEWIGDLSLRFFLNDKTTLKTNFQGLLITRNNYPSNSSRFIGHKEKGSLGLGLTRVLFPFLEGELFTKGFLMHAEKANYPEFKNGRNYRGFSTGLTLTSKF